MIKNSDTLTASKIKNWAYKNKKANIGLPYQLEELKNVVEHGELLLTMASDKNCPKRELILNCLYSLVGKSASTHNTADIGLVRVLLTKAASYQDTIIYNWVARSEIILRDMRKYDYIEWCEGGFVRKDLA